MRVGLFTGLFIIALGVGAVIFTLLAMTPGGLQSVKGFEMGREEWIILTVGAGAFAILGFLWAWNDGVDSNPFGSEERRGSPVGICMIVGGLACAGYFFLIFDPSVPSPLGGRMVNLGLLSDRIIGSIIGVGLAVVGAILCRK